MFVSIMSVPICFRRGIQIPLCKGKMFAVWIPITLEGSLSYRVLTNFSRLSWSKVWWENDQVIFQCQVASKKKQSCIHAGLMLQEAVAASRHGNNKCFVAYFDVTKAFDSVWINGLFKQLYDLGITGRIWRI